MQMGGGEFKKNDDFFDLVDASIALFILYLRPRDAESL